MMTHIRRLFLLATCLCPALLAGPSNLTQSQPVQYPSHMDYEIVEQAPLHVIGIEIRTTNENGQSSKDGAALWDRFYQDGISQQVPDQKTEETVAVYSEYEKDYTKPFNYLIGREVNSSDKIPDGLILKQVPTAKYALFTVDGPFPESLIQAWKDVWDSSLKRAYTFDLEVYPVDFDPVNNPKMFLYISLKD